jgi:hypothetical protein
VWLILGAMVWGLFFLWLLVGVPRSLESFLQGIDAALFGGSSSYAPTELFGFHSGHAYLVTGDAFQGLFFCVMPMLLAGSWLYWSDSRARKRQLRDSNTTRRMPAHATYSLGSMMLVVTVIAVLIGVTRLSIGLGVALMILIAPALLRTIVVTRREQLAGGSTRFVDRAATFVGSAGLTLILLPLLAVAAVIAVLIFCAADAMLNPRPPGMPFGP